ncbi:MAG: amylo-alpha-1,6-glucosidase [Cytophagales bacterium]
MAITLDKKHFSNENEFKTFEWLETNGLGGYASSSLTSINTRRYHGLLVAALKPPVERVVMLSRLEETLVFKDGTRVELFANQFPGIVSPLGYQHLKSFEKDFFSTFVFEVKGVQLKKTIFMPYGKNTTVVKYEVIQGTQPFYMDLRPFISFRDFHSLTRANDALKWEYSWDTHEELILNPYEGMPSLHMQAKDSKFVYFPGWYHEFEYLVELDRGQDFKEDLFSHGYFSKSLKKGDVFFIIASTESVRNLDGQLLMSEELERRKKLLEVFDNPDEIEKTLTLAADQFVVKRDKDLRTIIAGYHWFSDWGRDTMIALPGICLVTKRFDEAKKILQAFAKSVDKGMIPNRFPDDGEEPEYNTVDATLWYFVAIYQYYQYTKDLDFIQKELLPVLLEIYDWHKKGTRYNIIVDHEDGLLYSGEEGVQLTWMDAKVGDWVVTPRLGKPVEIKALWYNALRILQFFTGLAKDIKNETQFKKEADKIHNVFEKTFFNKESKCLYDCVGDYVNDGSVRPNQIFAISLPFDLLEEATAKKVLKAVENKLLTPYGLRSLEQQDPHYKGYYFGNQWSRDGSYHQGIVWGWLIGPYYTAKVKLEGDAGVSKVEKHLKKLCQHLKQAGIGSISEIFDAEEPFKPNGCIAQAWSVGEVLRAYVEDVKGIKPKI